jgi:CBS domain-containing protein
MKVSEIMNSDLVTVAPEDDVFLAARLMKTHNIGSVPVVSEEGRVRGILTDRDIVTRYMASDRSSEPKVREVMSRGVISVSPEDDIKMASDIMAGDQIRRLPVVRDGRLVGMLALADLARKNSCNMEAASALTDISEDRKKR